MYQYCKSYHSSKNRGFTLIELLIVISIIGVLAGLLFSNFSGARERARDAKRKSDLNQIKSALRLYYNDNQGFPDEALPFGSPFTDGTVTYMNPLPDDPLHAVQGSYIYAWEPSDDESFCLYAKLENQGDAGIAESQTRCSDCSPADPDTTYVVCQD